MSDQVVVTCVGKVSKINHAPQEIIEGAHLPLPGLESISGEPLMSVMCGQCDARSTVTFPAARHHHPLAGTKLYCLVTEAHVITTCPGLHSIAGRLGFEPTTSRSQVRHYATEPHTALYCQINVKM